MAFVAAAEIHGGLLTAVEMDVLEQHIPVDTSAGAAGGVFRVEHSNHTDEGRGIVEILLQVVGVAVLTLQGKPGDNGIVFYGDIPVDDVVDIRIVHVGAVQSDAGYVNNVAVFENDVADLLSAGLRTDLQALAPVVPNGAVLYQHVLKHIVGLAVAVHRLADSFFHIALIVAVEALNTDGIVEGAQEAVVDQHIHAVVHIDAVGIIPPAADDLYIGDA